MNLTYGQAFGFSLLFATPLLEFHGAKVHDTGSDLVNVLLLSLGEAQDVEGFLLGGNWGSDKVENTQGGPNPLSMRKRSCGVTTKEKRKKKTD